MRAVRQLALTLAAVAGVLCIVVSLAGFALGVRPLVFLSGSMGPTIDTGSLALARTAPSDDLRVGDIVSVPTPAGERVTHRIVQVEHQDGSAILRLKGDANEAADAVPYVVDHADIVLFSVPEAGYVLSWLSGPAGLFLLGLYVAVLASVIARAGRVRPVRARAQAPARAAAGVPTRRRHAAPRRTGARAQAPARAAARVPTRRRHAAPRRTAVLALFRSTGGGRHAAARPRYDTRTHVVAPARPGRHAVIRPRPRVTARPLVLASLGAAAVTAGLVVLPWAEPTLAAWADPAPLSGAQEKAYTVPAPDGSNCALFTPGNNASRGVNLTWPANVAPLPLLSYTTNVTGITVDSKSVVSSGSSKQLQVRYNPTTVSNRNQIATVTATPALTSTSTWAGPITTWKFRTGGSPAAQPVCGDATPAVVDIHAPDGATRTPTAERAYIVGATGCTADVSFCGTIADASTISSVTYVLRRTQGATVTCFNGASWVGTCNQIPAQSTVYNNQLTFYEDSTTGTVYPNTGTGSYTLTVTVTDSWANTTITAVSFTLS